jgi:hypothetical protein
MTSDEIGANEEKVVSAKKWAWMGVTGRNPSSVAAEIIDANNAAVSVAA